VLKDLKRIHHLNPKSGYQQLIWFVWHQAIKEEDYYLFIL